MSDNPILFFICALGVFNGFLVALYFLFFNRKGRVQNLLFGLLVLFLSMRIGKSLYVIFTPREERNIALIQVGLSACFLIGASLYYYLRSSLEQTKVFPRKWKVVFIILSVFIIGVGVVFPYQTNGSFWNTFFVYFIYAVWGIYLLLSAYILKDVFARLIAKKASTFDLWLVGVFVSNLLIFTAYIVGLFYLYFIGTITFSIVFYALLIFFLSKKKREDIFEDIPEKYGAKKIATSEADGLLIELKKLIEKNDLYKNTSIKISDIAKEINITPHKLSQLLNDNLGKSFAAYMNSYRIEEAKKMLKENQEFTLEAIGFESGFSSKSNFYATFKKEVGLTPSQFQKQFL
ncbi:MAG: helix-turn-helix domain-containing protein [Tenacibaculum sp.]|nr:helix-turn-helix domain-containing protein [Tenacibaculum sp.]